MPEYTQDELDYEEGHAASCICVRCETRQKKIDNAVSAMLNVTIREDHDPRGAVAELWRMLKGLEWSGQIFIKGIGYQTACISCHAPSDSGHIANCGLDAALKRFKLDDTEGVS